MNEKNILVFRAKKNFSKQKLKEFQRLWSNQVADGVVVIPNDFEFVSLDPNTLKPCEFEWQEIKKVHWWQKLIRIYTDTIRTSQRRLKNENTKRNS